MPEFKDSSIGQIVSLWSNLAKSMRTAARSGSPPFSFAVGFQLDPSKITSYYLVRLFKQGYWDYSCFDNIGAFVHFHWWHYSSLLSLLLHEAYSSSQTDLCHSVQTLLRSFLVCFCFSGFGDRWLDNHFGEPRFPRVFLFYKR
jgi:hypothetical protein